MTEKERERRRKLSETNRRKFLERVTLGPYEPPPEKPCSRCKKVKPIEEFHLRRYMLKSGILKVTPESQCKECLQEKERARIKKRKEEGTYKEFRERCEASRDKEKRREYARIWKTAERRRKGMKLRGPWHRYKDETRGEELPVGPFAAFIRQEIEATSSRALALELDRDEKRIRVWAEELYPHVSIRTVDYVLTKLGRPDLLRDLYPVKEDTYGYFKP